VFNTFGPQNVHWWTKIAVHMNIIPVGMQPNETTVIWRPHVWRLQ